MNTCNVRAIQSIDRLYDTIIAMGVSNLTLKHTFELTLPGEISSSTEVNYHDHIQVDSKFCHTQTCELSIAPFDEVVINFYEKVVLQF